ncbi:UBP-type zinc finger domain-containing protein [Fulvivirga sedimenti]|uniref:UBP-type zinc finger domain-containing protein n=1 Tax=Fulvivirga sedimenti TaxID=2879465 RepID=A0A9X1KYE4_9BACT|nr:UBP-type zinc finger domain-containing protein [Fulvivirga sedimenti]MCA6074710.1 UBP-type zinc finger domain-containing protein [Fulvivirga sedimenti]MCA6075887.1 UBP-type zinc finger domain-containing protein [Fulvivirga sedimenti]MCA6077015.1 UBP-type zinc finger domain-containing protein [Fulvivirga sedimenti]
MPLKTVLCGHLKDLKVIPPDKDYCEECLPSGDEWVHLRKCQVCGQTLCCDSSVNQHARKHFDSTGHEVIISAEPNEHWSYCYVDKYYNMNAF